MAAFVPLAGAAPAISVPWAGPTVLGVAAVPPSVGRQAFASSTAAPWATAALAGAALGRRRARAAAAARRYGPEVAREADTPPEAHSAPSHLGRSCGAAPRLQQRRQLALLGGIAGASPVGSAGAESVKVTKATCEDCGGEGAIQCLTCLGSGQFKMLGFRDGSVEAQYQFVSCPDCDGVGNRLCGRCYGTGLPSAKLKGFLRDPIFKKVLYRLKRQKVDLDTLPKLKEEVKEAVEEAEKRMADADAA